MHPAWGSLSDDEQHACVQDYLINHSSQHVLQARSVNGINLQWIRIPFIKDGIYDNMRKRVPQDTIEHIYSQVGGGDFVRGYNNILQYSKAVASKHPNADAIVTTSERRQLDAS